jgi:hypothetical protein
MNEEDTLRDVTDEPENHIEKPKRKASEKQLAALAAAREKRKTKPNALAPKALPPPPPEPAEPVADVIIKKVKPKKVIPKPTIIQIDSSSESSDEEPPAPTIIIRKSKPKKVAGPMPKVEPPPAAPKQYIRRA